MVRLFFYNFSFGFNLVHHYYYYYIFGLILLARECNIHTDGFKGARPELYDPLELLMSGDESETPVLDEESLLAANDGFKHTCHIPSVVKLALGFEGNQVDFGTYKH